MKTNTKITKEKLFKETSTDKKDLSIPKDYIKQPPDDGWSVLHLGVFIDNECIYENKGDGEQRKCTCNNCN